MATGGAAAPPPWVGVLPVFVHARNLPKEADKPYTVAEICGACEKKSGYGTILGAQRLGVWRIYPFSVEARTKLLLSGVVLRAVSVALYDKNPLIVRSENGETEIKTTKLTIGNLPISFSNEEILEMLKKTRSEITLCSFLGERH
jgi:hypothetical protein